MLGSCFVLLVLVVTSECLINVDLGYEVNEESMRWLNGNKLARTTLHKGQASSGEFWYEAYEYCTPEHLGTHLDAPSHLSKDGWTVSDIPLEHLIGQGVVVDIREKVASNPNAEMTEEDLTEWINVHGPLPDGAIVFVHTGWGSRYGNQTAYFGTPTDDTSNLTFPGIHISAAMFLTGYQNATNGSRIFGVGIDTASLDHGPSKSYPTHVELFSANIYGMENVANLDMLPPKGFEVIVMPIKLSGGSGGQARIIARIDETTEQAATTESQPEESKTEPKAEAQIQPKPETQIQPEPEPEPETEPKTETEPRPKTEHKTEPKTEPEPEPESEPEPEPTTEPQETTAEPQQPRGEHQHTTHMNKPENPKLKLAISSPTHASTSLSSSPELSVSHLLVLISFLLTGLFVDF